MVEVPQSPRARAGSVSSAPGGGGGGSQSSSSAPSSPFNHLVHRTSYIDLKALASPSDEDEDRNTDWSAFVDDSPTQRRARIDPGRLSTPHFVSPAEEEALRGGRRWARPGSSVVPPLLPQLFDSENHLDHESRGSSRSGGGRGGNPGSVRSSGSDDSGAARILSVFSNGGEGATGPEGRGTPGSFRSFRSNTSERGVPGHGARRTSSSVRSVLPDGADDDLSSATPLRRGGSQSGFKRQRTDEPFESSGGGYYGRKFLPDETLTEGTDPSDRSVAGVAGDLEAADLPLEHVNMSYFRSRDVHMAEDFDDERKKDKKRRVGLCCILCLALLVLIGLIVGLAVSEHKKGRNGGDGDAVAGAVVPDGDTEAVAAAAADSVPSSVPSAALTPSPTREPTTPEPSQDPTKSPVTSPTRGPTEAATVDWLLAILMRHSPYPDRLVAVGRNAQKRAYNWLAEDPLVRTYSERRVVQRWVLATAFFSQKDPKVWRSWKDHPNECYWLGIRCNFVDNVEDSDSGEWVVTGINVAHSFLEGVVPEEISLLEHLTELNLHGNSFLAEGFHGTIPTELGKLKNLKYLNLSSNSFEGTVPTELGSLPKLLDLRLARNSLGGSMPRELCDHRGGMCYLSADCDEVECDFGCCTRCCRDGGFCCYESGFCFF